MSRMNKPLRDARQTSRLEGLMERDPTGSLTMTAEGYKNAVVSQEMDAATLINQTHNVQDKNHLPRLSLPIHRLVHSSHHP